MTQIKPAIFNTTMVRAILARIKKNTRRPFSKYLKKVIDTAYAMGEIGSNGIDSDFDNSDKKYLMAFAPYKVGDIIYVRETFVRGLPDCFDYENGYNPITTFYKADGNIDSWWDEDEGVVNVPWKPSIHMPKEYARLFLRVKDVRIERLNEISSKDAMREGIEQFKEDDGLIWFRNYLTPRIGLLGSIESFASLWDSIYGRGSFDNRYVWVIEFEQISKEEAMSDTAT